MEYNTQRPELMIREYGRIIQNMARYAATIEDKNERNAAAREIIELMSQANVAFKNIEEYKHKLWDHLIMISDFKLVVDSPYPFPERKNVVVKSNEPLPYPKHKIKFRHYGRNLETLVAKTKDMDTEKRNGLSYVVANYMKLVYANWNKETVSDDTIRQDLNIMSKGLLELDKNYNFEAPIPTTPSQYSFKPQKKNFGKGGFGKKKRPFNGNNNSVGNRFKRRNNNNPR